ncbi:MAG: hypothetical protein IJN56_04075 [Clostridia bacterium]|nr:hypothetical protein [Clostridia bacterium]
MAKMKATVRNGRTNSAGRVFNPNHNTRAETRNLEGHIDHDRTALNVNFKIYANGNVEKCDSFDAKEFELSQYEILFGDGQTAKNERYIKDGHPERCKTVKEVYQHPKTCPMETIFQLGNRQTEMSPEERKQIMVASTFELIEQLRQKYGENIRFLDISLHNDESAGSEHIHARYVLSSVDKHGFTIVNQARAFAQMGIDRPDTSKKEGKYNNPLMTFSEMLRSTFYDLCEKNGNIEIDREVKNPSQKHRDILEYKCEQLQKSVAELTAERNTLRDQNNITKTIQASFDEVEIDIEAEAVPERTHRGQVVEPKKVKIKQTDFDWLKERAKLTIGIKTAFDKLQRYGKQLWQEVSRDKIVSDLTERAETAERRAREKEAIAKQLTDNLDRAYQDLHEQEAFMRRIGVWQRFCNFIKEKFRERQEAEHSDRTR